MPVLLICGFICLIVGLGLLVTSYSNPHSYPAIFQMLGMGAVLIWGGFSLMK